MDKVVAIIIRLTFLHHLVYHSANHIHYSSLLLSRRKNVATSFFSSLWLHLTSSRATLSRFLAYWHWIYVVSNQNLRRQINTIQLSYRKEDRAMRCDAMPNIWVHWKVLRVLTTHPTTFPEICNELLFRSILRMCVQNLKFVALPVPETIKGTQKIGQSLDTPTLHFLPKF